MFVQYQNVRIKMYLNQVITINSKKHPSFYENTEFMSVFYNNKLGI